MTRRAAPILGSVLALATALVVASAHDRPRVAPQAPVTAAPSVTERSSLDDRVLADIAGRSVAGVLAGRRVLLVTGPGIQPARVSQAVATLVASGARLSGTLALTPAFLDPLQARELENLVTGLVPPGVVLPARRTPGAVAAAVLARALVAPTAALAGDVPDDAAALLAGLVDAGYAHVSGSPATGATLAVVLTGTTAADPQILVALSTALAGRAAAVVVAAPHGATGPRTPVGAIRAGAATLPRLSTVDAVDTVAGRYAVPLALAAGIAGRAGHFGDGPGAGAPMPPLTR